MSSDALDYARPTPRSRWRRRLIVGALFAVGVALAMAIVAAVLAVMEPNLLPRLN